MRYVILAALLLLVPGRVIGDEVLLLPGTQPLTENTDFSDQMMRGFETFLKRQTEQSIVSRASLWNRDVSSPEAYQKSIQPNRERLAKLIGAVDPRLPIVELQYVGGTRTPHHIGETTSYTAYAVRWPVLEGVEGEGLLLVPKGPVLARVICLPDADQTPEMLVGLASGIAPELQYAHHLAHNGSLVIVPTLIDRQDTWSGDPNVWMTNQPHREWVYRPAFELGRHIIGYEVQKVLALVDYLASESDQPIGVAGYGEGGLIAFYSAALDPRIDAALVSGYFDSRQDLWQEPIYRNVFGLLQEFGDAEIASLIAPRPLVIEHSISPEISGPPAVRDDRRDVAAPGRLRTPALEVIRAELQRFQQLCPSHTAPHLITGPEGHTIGPGSSAALATLLRHLQSSESVNIVAVAERPVEQRKVVDPAARQQRQLRQLIDHTQLLLDRSATARGAFWSKAQAGSPDEWSASSEWYRNYLWDEILGRFPSPTGPCEARTRQVLEAPKWVGYEVVLDVYPDVIVWGYLLVPKEALTGDGKRRPVVVCQHGLEGLPMDVITNEVGTQGFTYYQAFAARLAERGYVTFAPHHYYRGGDRFRQAQRMAYPLKKTLFAITIAQHERLLQWLGELPFVDSQRIGFYGLSYGGFSAMRVPSILKGYALSINSAEFNDMALKKASVHDQYSYPFHRTYEVFEFNLANTFGYSDLAGLIAPRPFMVERGHRDGVAPDEWVASEFAKVRRRYTQLGIPDRTRVEFFDGPHAIHGVGTFEFLDQHLKP